MAFASFSAANTVIQGHPKKTLELPISSGVGKTVTAFYGGGPWLLPWEILKSRVYEIPLPAFWGEIL